MRLHQLTFIIFAAGIHFAFVFRCHMARLLTLQAFFGKIFLFRAGVAERQTQKTQNLPMATSCGFESHLPHSLNSAYHQISDFYSEINQINPDADLRETTFFLDFADLRNQLLAGIHEP